MPSQHIDACLKGEDTSELKQASRPTSDPKAQEQKGKAAKSSKQNFASKSAGSTLERFFGK